MGLGFAFKLRA